MCKNITLRWIISQLKLSPKCWEMDTTARCIISHIYFVALIARHDVLFTGNNREADTRWHDSSYTPRIKWHTLYTIFTYCSHITTQRTTYERVVPEKIVARYLHQDKCKNSHTESSWLNSRPIHFIWYKLFVMI